MDCCCYQYNLDEDDDDVDDEVEDDEDDEDNEVVDDDDDEDHEVEDDIYIMMQCLCVCLSRKMITFPSRAERRRREARRPLGLTGRRPALA